MKRLSLVALWLSCLAGTAAAYTHFVHYAGRNGPYVEIREKFDLSALTGNTVQYFVSERGPDVMVEGDSSPALLSEIHLAARTWSSVPTSELRLAFGGFVVPGAKQARPRIVISFEELPPGLLAQGAPTIRAEVVTSAAEPFVPIVGAVMQFSRDLSQQPSFGPGFYMTTLHEMGHALGLQHTFTSSAMSVELTRALTRGNPLGPDDVAAISLLYPSASFASTYGTISGRVAMDGAGVHMASVVALTSTGYAVSALTHPDGTYRMEGVPPGYYYVYAHPLPPNFQPELGPGDIVLPVDPDGVPFPAGEPFKTQFYPGTQDHRAAQLVRVTAAEETPAIDFFVQPRGPLSLYDVQVFSFPGAYAMQPAFINLANPERFFLVAGGPGLVVDKAPAPGLDVSVLGQVVTIPPGGVSAYYDPNWVRIDLRFNTITSEGPRHLVFSTPDDIYVLPAAFTLVRRQPPSISAVERSSDDSGRAVVVLTGKSFDANTRILFDGVPAETVKYDVAGSQLTVVPPPAAAGYTAHLIAVNTDGQSSSFIQWPPQTYTYDPGDPGAVMLGQASLAAGTEGMVEIFGAHANFVPGQVQVGFGSSDILARRMWVVSPNLVRVNVAAGSLAEPGNFNLTVTSGTQVMTQPAGLQVRPGDPAQVSLGAELVNADAHQAGVYPGGNAIATVNNLAAAGPNVSLVLGGSIVRILSVTENQILFEVPRLPAGPAVMRLVSDGLDIATPVIVNLDAPPPAVQAVAVGDLMIGPERAARLGTVVALYVSGLGEPFSALPVQSVQVNIGGLRQDVYGDIIPAPGRDGQHRILVYLSPSTPPGDNVPVVVTFNGRASAPFFVPVIGY